MGETCPLEAGVPEGGEDIHIEYKITVIYKTTAKCYVLTSLKERERERKESSFEGLLVCSFPPGSGSRSCRAGHSPWTLRGKTPGQCPAQCPEVPFHIQHSTVVPPPGAATVEGWGRGPENQALHGSMKPLAWGSLGTARVLYPCNKCDFSVKITDT